MRVARCRCIAGPCRKRARQRWRPSWWVSAPPPAKRSSGPRCRSSSSKRYRDIKSSNLLLDRQGTVWITDFGLARTEGTEHLTHTGDTVGTLRYMAQERFSGWSDPRSDLYSLGLTLYELLTLGPAFEESDRARLIKTVTQEEPLPPRRVDRTIPRDLETIVLKAITREPGQRYASGTEMAEDLRRFLEDQPILARRTSRREHA